MINKNEIQNQFNKFPVDKVELEKVQLSVMTDMKKSLATIKSQVKKAAPIEAAGEKLNAKIEADVQKLKEKANIADKLQQEMWKNTDAGKKLEEKVEAAAKELGVSPDSVEGYKEYKAVRGQAYFDAKRLGDVSYYAEQYS